MPVGILQLSNYLVLSCVKSIINQIKTSPKLFHAYLRKKKTNRPTVGPFKVNGIIVSDSSGMADALVNAFSSVFVTDVPTNPAPHQTCNVEMHQPEISCEKIVRLLKSLKDDSSMGPDYVRPLFLKRTATVIALPLSMNYKKSLKDAKIPSSWKVATSGN